MNASEPVFPKEHAISSGDALLIALFIAAAIHALLILGISFNVPEPDKIDQSISVTLANFPTEDAPEKAKYLAQQNQRGAGRKKTKPKPQAQQLPGQGNKPETLATQRAVQNQSSSQRVLTRKDSNQIMNSGDRETRNISEPKPKLSPESLSRQIAQLGTEVRNQELSADLDRIKYVNAVSTHKYLAANYEREWQAKVQKTGNLNYPEIARQKRYSGNLVMAVGINYDGTIYSIRINRSSGYPSLDEAAKRIVRMSAPFAPLPENLRKELDVLVITRVWQFSDESGMSAQ